MICLCIITWFCYRCCWKVYYDDHNDDIISRHSRYSHSSKKLPDITISKIGGNDSIINNSICNLSNISECDSEKVGKIIDKIEK